MGKEIENPWCTYGWYNGPWGFGKIEHEYKKCVTIRYSEGQYYNPESWESKWVKRFPTLEEAVEDYIKNRGDCDIRDRQSTPEEVKQQAREKFPSYFESKEDNYLQEQ